MNMILITNCVIRLIGSRRMVRLLFLIPYIILFTPSAIGLTDLIFFNSLNLMTTAELPFGLAASLTCRKSRMAPEPQCKLWSTSRPLRSIRLQRSPINILFRRRSIRFSPSKRCNHPRTRYPSYEFGKGHWGCGDWNWRKGWGWGRSDWGIGWTYLRRSWGVWRWWWWVLWRWRGLAGWWEWDESVEALGPGIVMIRG